MSLILVNTEWTSKRPQALPDPDGKFKFDRYDPLTGVVAGNYHDIPKGTDDSFEGSVTFNGGTSYLFVLHHTVHLPAGDVTRLYEGELLVNTERIALVAGTFTTLPSTRPGGGRFSKEELAELGQDEGVWVATKP